MTPATEMFNHAIQQAHEWLLDLKDNLGWTDEHKALRALRVVLHALRDRLSIEEAAQLGSQLPTLVRGFYYEGWKPSGKPLKERTKEQFLAHIRDGFKPDESLDWEEVTRGVFLLLSERVSEGEIEDIKANLPKPIRKLWDQGLAS